MKDKTRHRREASVGGEENMAQGKKEEVGTGYEKWICRGREECRVSIVDTEPWSRCWRGQWKKVH